MHLFRKLNSISSGFQTCIWQKKIKVSIKKSFPSLASATLQYASSCIYSIIQIFFLCIAFNNIQVFLKVSQKIGFPSINNVVMRTWKKRTWWWGWWENKVGTKEWGKTIHINSFLWKWESVSNCRFPGVRGVCDLAAGLRLAILCCPSAVIVGI